MRSLLVLALLVSGCRPLLPPPKDLDAYCRRILAATPTPVPPECIDTADKMLEPPSPPMTYETCLDEAKAAEVTCTTMAAFARGANNRYIKGPAEGVCEERLVAAITYCKARYREEM